MSLGRRWYRFRWWLVRKLAPEGVWCLYVRGRGKAVDLMSEPSRLWGNAYRYVSEEEGEVLSRLEASRPWWARKLEGRDGHALDSLSMFRRAGRYPAGLIEPSDYYEPEALPDEGVARELDVSFESTPHEEDR